MKGLTPLCAFAASGQIIEVINSEQPVSTVKRDGSGDTTITLTPD